MSADEEEGDEVYCICRSSDCSRFMIGCDKCEEWYHGDCIDVTERQAKYIKRFYCDRCRKRNPDLKIKYKDKSRNKHHESREKEERKEKHREEKHKEEKHKEEKHKEDKHKEEKHKEEKHKEEKLKEEKAKEEKLKEKQAAKEREEARRAARAEREKEERAAAGCGLCAPCQRTGDCGRCSACRAAGSRPCKRRVCAGPPEEPAAAVTPLREANRGSPPPPPRSSPPPPAPAPAPAARRRSVTEPVRRGTGGRRRKRELESDTEEPPDASGRQCYGPQCVKQSRQGSRYCSDQCGLNLARNRIFQVLPQRIQEWNMTRCVAEDRNMRTLERIRRDQLEAQTQLERLTRAHQELDRTCERGRRGTVDPAALEDDTEEEQHGVHCVTCGHEVLTKNIVRHMEKCFAKYESQTSFGSLYQTRVEGFNMFCDFYNPTNRTYCKRLRVLCPEHSKNPKVSDDEVCGCPLVTDVFNEIGQYCRAPKKKCVKHFCWEKLRRAELDMERVRWAMKMDELLEQERQCRQSMANRAGVLALMLHSTYDHDVMERVQSQQKKMASKVKVKVS